MALNSYFSGNLIHLTASFTVSGVAADPTTVTLTVKDPTSALTTPAVTKDSVGNYHADITASISGSWYYKWVGSGACVAASEGEFIVLPTSF